MQRSKGRNELGGLGKQGGLWQLQVSRGREQELSLELPAWLTGSACSFIFNLRSIKKHCRALISGVGYPDSGFYYVSLAVERMGCGWVEGGKSGRRCGCAQGER